MKYDVLVVGAGPAGLSAARDLTKAGTFDLADELSLTIVPFLTDADRASFAAASDEFGKLARTVDPDDPWSHPEAERLDRLSLGDWLRDRGATRGAGPPRLHQSLT